MQGDKIIIGVLQEHTPSGINDTKYLLSNYTFRIETTIPYIERKTNKKNITYTNENNKLYNNNGICGTGQNHYYKSDIPLCKSIKKEQTNSTYFNLIPTGNNKTPFELNLAYNNIIFIELNNTFGLTIDLNTSIYFKKCCRNIYSQNNNFSYINCKIVDKQQFSDIEGFNQLLQKYQISHNVRSALLLHMVNGVLAIYQPYKTQEFARMNILERYSVLNLDFFINYIGCDSKTALLLKLLQKCIVEYLPVEETAYKLILQAGEKRFEINWKGCYIIGQYDHDFYKHDVEPIKWDRIVEKEQINEYNKDNYNKEDFDEQNNETKLISTYINNYFQKLLNRQDKYRSIKRAWWYYQFLCYRDCLCVYNKLGTGKILPIESFTETNGYRMKFCYDEFCGSNNKTDTEPDYLSCERLKDYIERHPLESLTSIEYDNVTTPIHRLPSEFGSNINLHIYYENGKYYIKHYTPYYKVTTQSRIKQYQNKLELNQALTNLSWSIKTAKVRVNNNKQEKCENNDTNELNLYSSSNIFIDPVISIYISPDKDTGVPLYYGSKIYIYKSEYYYKLLRYNSAICSIKGSRITMEDESYSIEDLNISNVELCSVYSIFDGHGGNECSKFLKYELPLFLKLYLSDALKIIYNNAPNNYKPSNCWDDKDLKIIKRAIVTTFHMLDSAYLNSPFYLKSGSTCSLLLIFDNIIVAANTGDSRFLYVSKTIEQVQNNIDSDDESYTYYNNIPTPKAGEVYYNEFKESNILDPISRSNRILLQNKMQLTQSNDHRPNNFSEFMRVTKSNTFIKSSRVFGRLAVTRALGDLKYKHTKAIIAEPEVYIYKFNNISTSAPEFLVLGCDGVFDVWTSEHLAYEIVNSYISLGRFTNFNSHSKDKGERPLSGTGDIMPIKRDTTSSLADFVCRLVDITVNDRKSSDNITLNIIFLKS